MPMVSLKLMAGAARSMVVAGCAPGARPTAYVGVIAVCERFRDRRVNPPPRPRTHPRTASRVQIFVACIPLSKTEPMQPAEASTQPGAPSR